MLCKVTCGLTHKYLCASGRICLPSSTRMWSNTVWHVEGLTLWRRLAVLLVLSELIRGGRRHIAARKDSLRFPCCDLFFSSCRLRQTFSKGEIITVSGGSLAANLQFHQLILARKSTAGTNPESTRCVCKNRFPDHRMLAVLSKWDMVSN